MPWMWDYFNYSGDNADMLGFFYPEDYNCLNDIEQLEVKGKNRRQAEANRAK